MSCSTSCRHRPSARQHRVSLSGGERRRCEIARALATFARLILLDEPFAGVDPIAVLDIQKIIRLSRERGIGVLITDHNVREKLRVSANALHHQRGRSPRQRHADRHRDQ